MAQLMLFITGCKDPPNGHLSSSRSAASLAHRTLKPPGAIRDLQEVIRARHGCGSVYRRTVLVEEKFDPTICWSGLVNIFDVVNHPTAGCCFAWTYREGREMKSETVLNTPPVHSPDDAVRAVFAARTAVPSP